MKSPSEGYHPVDDHRTYLKTRCVGGPFDGMEVELGERLGRFAYVGMRRDEKGVKTYAKPAQGRHLHRADPWQLGGGMAWIYAENRWYRCANCGAFTEKAEGGAERVGCAICGS